MSKVYAKQINLLDANGLYEGSTVEAALQELTTGRFSDVVIVRDKKTTGTGGGTSTSGAWRTRDLTEIVADTGGHASLGSNQVTLAAGTYVSLIVAPARNCDSHKCRLRNITDGATIAEGMNATNGAGSGTQTNHTFLFTRFTLSASKVLEVQHQVQTTQTNGFGLSISGFTPDEEVYTQAVFLKEGSGASGGLTQFPMDYVLIEDQKSTGTNGGTFSSGAWRTRDLNTIVADTGGHASVGSNQITLAAGTYVFNASAPAVQVDGHKLRLQNVTDGATLADEGASVHSSVSVGDNDKRGIVSGIFTISTSKTLELQHRCTTTGGGDSFGLNVGVFPAHETYSRIEFWRFPDSATSLQGVPTGYRFGGAISNNGADADHDVDVATGLWRDSGDVATIKLTTALTKQIDANWAEGTNAGGFPSTLTLSADTWYHVFVIKDTALGKVDAGFDTSIIATNLLSDSGYDVYRRLGSVLTDPSSNIIAFTQIGVEFLWNDPPSDANTTTTTSAVLYTLSVPPDVRVEAAFNTAIWVSTDEGRIYVSNPAVNDEPPTGSSAAPYASQKSDINRVDGSLRRIVTNTSSQIRARSDVALGIWAIATVGWRDFLED